MVKQKVMLSVSINTSEALYLILKAVKEDKEYIELPAWKNEKKKSDNSPDYKSRGCSIWIKEYTPKDDDLEKDLLGME